MKYDYLNTKIGKKVLLGLFVCKSMLKTKLFLKLYKN